MILQTDYSEFAWIIGLGISFGFALAITIILSKGYRTFLAYFMVIIGFCVFAELLDLWLLILMIIVNSVIIVITIKDKRSI